MLIMSLLGSANKIEKLHKLISNGYVGGVTALSKELKTSRGTVYNYFDYMKSVGVLVLYDEQQRIHYYDPRLEVKFQCGFSVNERE